MSFDSAEYRARPENREKAKRRNAEHYARNRQRISLKRLARKIEFMNLLGGECARCGFDHPAALHFHHRDPATKLFDVAQAIQSPRKYDRETVVTEVMKCDLLCANCHEIEHCVYWDAAISTVQDGRNLERLAANA